MKKKKLIIALTSTFASIATIGVTAGIVTQLNSKDNSVNVVTNSYVIKDRLSSEILLNNTVLNLLNNNINKFIQSNKLSFVELKNYLLEDSKLDEFKSNLVEWSNNVLSLESIGDIKLINDNDSIKLIVNSNDMYQFNSINDSPYFDSNNSSLVFENLNLYNDIYFNNKNISDFKSQLQNKINLEKFTLADYIKFTKSDQFIDFVLENLKTSQGTFIESMIGDISFDDKTNELLIGASDIYKIILDNESVQNIVISDLQFFEDVKLSISSTLHKSLQETIDNEKFTPIQYENYIKDNKVIMKE
ncbi:MAG: hypothetical protein K2L64_03905 [Ureaplasma sp.]|nr:hypothetical protein [Ureaplasma sp.]